MIKKGKLLLWTISIYISIVGLVTFSLFISEEAFQTTMFGTWPAKDAQRWDLVKKGTDLMQAINTQSKVINYGVGWIQPLAFFSYRAYSKSADFYVEALRAQAIAQRPELFLGEYVNLSFTPQELSFTDDGRYIIRNGNIGVISHKEMAIEHVDVSGTLEFQQGLFVINKDQAP